MPAPMRIYCSARLKSFLTSRGAITIVTTTICYLIIVISCGVLFTDRSTQTQVSCVRECIGDENLYLLPTEDGINIDKLGQLGTITTYTCNNAQMQRRLLILHSQGKVIEQDCNHHLWNV
jgi:hypothetical protein